MSSVNNKKILKNTLFLYIRMFLIMGISLYTVRAYLGILGEVDYGLYNVIGGVVSMLSFLNGTLAASSQRFISVALAEGDKEKVNKIFCLGQTVYLFIIIIAFLFFETAGLWFINVKLIIPTERVRAANFIYQISILTFVFQMLSVAYNAMVIAQERMKAFAYIGVLEAGLKLTFVFVLRVIPFDKLIGYGLLLFIINLLVFFIYVIFCRINFAESRFKFYWNKNEALEILGFSGWHLLGTFSIIIRGSGVNVLINTFFNPTVNTARAIAYQVEGALTKFSQNFFNAVKPQMYKSYASNEIEELNKLIMRSTIICVFLLSLFTIPLYNNLSFVLQLWLKDVPELTVQFTQLVLINGLIDSTADSLICPALATGRIKKFYIVTGSLYILVLPVSYIFLKLGFSAPSTLIVSIVMSILAVFARAIILNKLIDFPLKKYFILIGKLSLLTIVLFYSIKLIIMVIPINKWGILLSSIIISTFLHIILYILFIISKDDRTYIKDFIKNKFLR